MECLYLNTKVSQMATINSKITRMAELEVLKLNNEMTKVQGQELKELQDSFTGIELTLIYGNVIDSIAQKFKK